MYRRSLVACVRTAAVTDCLRCLLFRSFNGATGKDRCDTPCGSAGPAATWPRVAQGGDGHTSRHTGRHPSRQGQGHDVSQVWSGDGK